MALTDPQSITISGSTISLPRTNVGSNQSEYRASDGTVKLSLSSAYGRRTRQVIRVDHNKVSADPYLPAQNSKVSMSCYMVFDRPDVGYTNTEALAIYTGFKGLYTASTDAIITKLLGGES